MKGNIEIEVAVEAEHVKRTMKEYAEKVLFPQRVKEWKNECYTIVEVKVIHWYWNYLLGLVKYTVPKEGARVKEHKHLLCYELEIYNDLDLTLSHCGYGVSALRVVENYCLSKL